VEKLITNTAPYAFAMKRLIDLGKGNDKEKQVPGAVSFYKEPFFETLLINLLPSIENQTGVELFKTYSYGRYYHLNEELKPHTDRKACEITASLCLQNEADSWPIWIKDRNGVNHSFSMHAGDAVIFKGIELEHWREKTHLATVLRFFFIMLINTGYM